ncbi:MAG: ribonuclease Z [Telluria sp.]
MELLFLGTSSGTPTTRRNVSALALRGSNAGHWSLVDCGEGTQHQILRTPLSPRSLRAVFITHLHGDHCYGLPGLLASAGLLNRSEPLDIVGPAGLQDFIEGVMATTCLTLPYPITWHDVTEPLPTSLLPDFGVAAAALSHRVPCYAYVFTERDVPRKLDADKLRALGLPSGPLWGQVQQGQDVRLPDGRVLAADDVLLPSRKPRKIIVAGDNDRPELLAHAALGADVLVHEATYTEDILARVGPGPQHSSARRVAQFAEAARLPNLILTHFSPRYGDGDGPLSINDIEREANSHYTGRLFLARDFARYALGTDHSLAPLE